MYYKRIDDIGAETLTSLIGSEPENLRLEFKRDLPGNSEDDKAEFLKDVSAFANADGGDIIYGMAAVKGVASKFFPIDNTLLDDTKNKLHQVLDFGIRPRIPNVVMQPVEVEPGKSLLIVRIPQSQLRPHQVTAKHSYKFYGRNTAGTYVIEVDELRDTVLRQASLPDRMRDFRRARIELIRNHPEDMPHALDYERKLVMHFLPEETFGRGEALDVSALINDPRKLQQVAYSPIEGLPGANHRTNIDGVLFMNGNIAKGLGWYVQVFNDGSIEFVDCIGLWNSSNEAVIYPGNVERDLFGGYDVAVRVFKALGIQGRFLCLVSFLGARDLSLRTPSRMPLTFSMIGGDVTLGRDPALFNAVVVEDMDAKADKALYPMVSQMWRAFAFNKPYSYDDEGNHKGRAYYSS